MPKMKPLKSALNLTPSSTEAESLIDGFAGVVELFQPLQGHAGAAAVVKDQVTSAWSAFPARSLTPPAPPSTVAVYVLESASDALGVSTAVVVAGSYVTVAAIGAF